MRPTLQQLHTQHILTTSPQNIERAYGHNMHPRSHTSHLTTHLLSSTLPVASGSSVFIPASGEGPFPAESPFNCPSKAALVLTRDLKAAMADLTDGSIGSSAPQDTGGAATATGGGKCRPAIHCAQR